MADGRPVKNHLSGAILIRGFQLLADLAVGGEGQAFLRNCGAADVSTQAFQPVALISPRGHTRMQGEPGFFR